jgi:hypothetical protein
VILGPHEIQGIFRELRIVCGIDLTRLIHSDGL